ncbi:MAG: hypothetical protein M3229_05075 [Actinomycetota bacterium]|nr:hypothetical protein [Actinomycetota bacterium]
MLVVTATARDARALARELDALVA